MPVMLEWPMRAPRACAKRERVADLLHEREARAEIGEVVVRDGAFEIVPFEQFHGHEKAAGVFAEIVHDDDVGVGEASGRLCLATEALPLLVIAGADDLQRDGAVEDRVVGAIHLRPLHPRRSDRGDGTCRWFRLP